MGLAKSRIEDRDKLMSYCEGLGHSGVTDECIRKGKKSESKSVRKIATKAVSAKNWNKGS